MNSIKMFGLAILVATALTAFANTASATTATSPSGTSYTGEIHALSEGPIRFEGNFVTVKCEITEFSAAVESHGASVTAEGEISSLVLPQCNYNVTVKHAGALIFHATSGGNGTVTWTGAELALHTSIGECVITSNGTHIGTFTGGSKATLDIEGKIPRTGGSFLCGSSVQWTASYQITTPGTLLVS